MTVSRLYITDKSGKKFWPTTVTTEYSQGESNNMRYRLDCIKRQQNGYAFIDASSAKIVEEQTHE